MPELTSMPDLELAQASSDEPNFLADFSKRVGERLGQLDAPNSEMTGVTSNSVVYDLDEKKWKASPED